MTDEQREKREFVRGKLYALLLGIDPHIASVDYGIQYSHEIVQITWANGYIKDIEVTADSLKALTMDVLRRI